MYNLLIDNIDIDPDDIVLDAYSGIGSISLKIAKRVRKVYGLEIISEAVDNARENAKLNDIKNTQFYVGNVVKTIDKIQDKIKIIDFIILTPLEAIFYPSVPKHRQCKRLQMVHQAIQKTLFLMYKNLN